LLTQNNLEGVSYSLYQDIKVKIFKGLLLSSWQLWLRTDVITYEQTWILVLVKTSNPVQFWKLYSCTIFTFSLQYVKAAARYAKESNCM
jgi:hypothetical protein